MKISHHFDSGNIKCLDSSNPDDVRLEIIKDNNSDFYQWFHFRVAGAKEQPCTFNIVNAGQSAYVKGWEDYRAVASYDRETWFRVDTQFDGQTLTIDHEPEFDSVYYAYFAPYSMEQHADLIAAAQVSEHVEVINLGETLDGQDMDLLKIGEAGEGKKICWMIARQHPGETMAEWWMEGMLGRLLDDSDPIARELLNKAVFYVVPNMNPDGSRRGHLRTNAAGANLNREWLEPSMDSSPEVFLVRQKMEETGMDFCLDVHGDEALPYNFIAGSEGVPGWTEERQALHDHYLASLVQASPDFQTEHGYEKDQPGQALMTVCTNYLAHAFNCLSMTLEMPFKDTVDTPDVFEGWSPQRCRKLGEANLDALYRTIDKL